MHGGPVKVLSMNGAHARTHTHTHTRARTHAHTHTRYIPDVSSSAESENPRICNPDTVVIFGMIGTLSEY